ncbi:hypothetical protein AN639_00785 [Candidatus Epulonipiscium fishelsonii]|uniref:Uncharacterized protein n=1 Tax=Candidatus Epulonipiscium fishelsonii TaxID=77094 RepID=A0ACC8X7U8_9FIRM|nr:hypothetical protein AN396_12370 [Epulopiscium sp. SCG-B11WGA-EpuloA1]ONI41333.1 hypothetical protein AN639_00785 [Epulopiscium sp. SCG-B05WGA-EpuloA1]
MKKKLITGLLLFTIAGTVIGCGSGAEGEGGTSESIATKKTKENAAINKEETGIGQIAIITPVAAHGWLAGVTYYAEQRAQELGLDYKTYQSANVNEQANDIQDAIAAGSSAIVMFPQNDEVSIATQAIIDEGIPLIVFDRKIDADYDAFIAGNNGDMGIQSAKVIGEALDGDGIVAVQNVPSVGSVSTERVNGFKNVMSSEYPDITLVDFTTEGFAKEQGLSAAADLLTANPELDAIYSLDDESSMGFVQAINEAGRTDVKIISGGGGSQDYFEMIGENGDIDLFTATYSPMMMKDAVDLAVAILTDKEVERDNILPTIIVDETNYQEYLDENSPY